MKQNFTLWSFLFLWSLWAPAEARAHTGSLRGVVYDGQGRKPLEGVSVFLKTAGNSAVTDAFGRFFIKGIEPGKYSMSLRHVGFETVSEEVKIEDGVTTDIARNMAPAAVKISEVSVNAGRSLHLGSISGLDLQMRPANSTQDLLRLVPGLFTAQHQGGGKAEQIFLRGFDCDHGTDVNITVDNMPVNMVSHAHGQGFADTHFIIPESIQETDYGKGPYQLDKGDLCTAGYVAFRTKNELDNSFIKTDVGMYGYQRAVAGINLLNRQQDTNGHQDAWIMGEYGSNRSYFDQSQDFRKFNIAGKYTDYISSNKILSLTLSGFSSTWSASGQLPARAISEGITDRFGDLDPEGGATSRYNLNLQYFQSIDANSYLKSNLFLTYYKFRLYSDFTYYLTDTVNGDQIRQAEQRAMGGYNSEYTSHYTLGGLKMKTQLGMGIRYDHVLNDELSHTAEESVLVNRIALGDVYQTNVYGYAGQTINLTPELVLTAGSRYDFLVQQYTNKLTAELNNQTFSNGRLSPKAGLYYNIGDHARIYYSYGTGFHSNDTRTLASGGDALTSRNSIPYAFSQDIGFVVKPRKELLLSLAFSRLDLQQEYTYNGDIATVDTSGKTRRYCIDFSARYEPIDWLYFDADLNYAHGRFTDQPQGNNYIPLAPSFTSTGGITFQAKNHFTAGLRYRHMSNRPATQDNSLTAQGYTVFDAVARYSLAHFEFGAQIQNLFNVQWNEAQFATETRLRYANGALEPRATTDVCFTPGTPFFLKLSAAYKF